jgi:hypothetical protein
VSHTACRFGSRNSTFAIRNSKFHGASPPSPQWGTRENLECRISSVELECIRPSPFAGFLLEADTDDRGDGEFGLLAAASGIDHQSASLVNPPGFLAENELQLGAADFNAEQVHRVDYGRRDGDLASGFPSF